VLRSATIFRRLLAVACLTVVVFGLRLLPAPPAASADLCGTFPVSLACGAANGIASALSTVVNVGGTAAKLTVNTASGAISLGGKVVGKVVNGAGGLACTVVGKVGEGWWGNVCSAAKNVLGKALTAAGKVKSKLPSPSTTGQIAGGGGMTFAGIAGWIGAAAVWVLHKGAGLVSSTTEPNVHAPFFEHEYGRMLGLAALLALPLLLLAVVEGTLRSNWEILTRALVAVPTAFLLTAMAVILVGIGVTLTDLMGQSAAAGAQEAARKFFDHAAIVLGALLVAGGAVGHFLGGHAPAVAHAIKGAPLFLLAVGSLYTFLAAGLVLLELFMREVGIFATLLFVPIVLAARIWPRLSHWGRDLTQGLVALILSKFVIVAILAFAAAAGASWNPAVLLIGVTLSTVAAISPVALFGLVRFADHSWHQRTIGRGTLVQTQAVSAADQMRRTFMAHNPDHRIDTPGTRAAHNVELVADAAGSAPSQSRSTERTRERVDAQQRLVEPEDSPGRERLSTARPSTTTSEAPSQGAPPPSGRGSEATRSHPGAEQPPTPRMPKPRPPKAPGGEDKG
jgi:hypothetical protein